MRRLLVKLFSPSLPHDHYIHYHFDDDGKRRVCDESACRPTYDPLSDALRLHAPFR